MSDTRVDFSAPAILRKWPSVNKERVSASLGARPYMIIEGTLDECIRKFMSQPKSQHHLYEIHTAPQADLVSAILSADHVVELARLRDFLQRHARRSAMHARAIKSEINPRLFNSITSPGLKRSARTIRRTEAFIRSFPFRLQSLT
jgi:hypothetical protein